MPTKRRSRNTSSRQWPKNLLARLRAVRQKIADSRADALLVVNPVDIRYLTDFPGEDAWMVVTNRTVVILSDTRFKEELDRDHAYARSVMRKATLSEEVAKVVEGQKIKRLAFQADYTTVTQRDALAKHVGASKLRAISGWLIKQRAIKDDNELKLIRKAIDIQQKAFEQLRSQIKPGMTEKQVAAQLEYNMRCLGADGPSFPTIVGFGANSSINHYLPGDVKLKKNQPILIDFGALYRGYCSDMTRVLVVGEFPKQIAEIYRIVREAMAAGIDAIKPGVELAEIDSIARNLIKQAGFAKRFGHGLGHGIGLDIHEEPRLGAKAKGVLEPGQVVTVEPGIYLPGIGGVRLENDVLVTKNGHRDLCDLPTDLESAMI